jgi:hypothetical protein
MSQNYTWPSVSVTASNPSTGSNGSSAPIYSTEVGGINPSNNLQPLQTDSSGNLKVVVESGSSTVQNVNLANVGGTAIALGQALMASSLPVVIASNQSTLAISAASLPLPSGASTSALQTQISGQLPASLGQKVSASSLAVVIASDQSTLPLPTGAATSANQTTMITDLAQIATNTAGIAPGSSGSGQYGYLQLGLTSTTQPAYSTGLVEPISLDLGGAVRVNGSAVTQPVSAASLPLPTGAATSANQTSEITQLTAINSNTSHLPAALGQTTMSASLPVVIASNQSSIATTIVGKSVANAPIYNSYSSTNVTTSAYVQLVASTSSTVNMIEIFDSSGQSMIIGVGASGSEVIQLYTTPGGNGQVPLAIPSGSRVAIKALTGSATSGYITINFYS